MAADLTFRLATADDLPQIIALLADDPLGASREQLTTPLPVSYRTAFDRIQNDPGQELTVAEMAGQLVGTFQLTFIPYLTHQGSLRAQIEAVRVHSAYRGQHIGTLMFQYASERATQKGCRLLQLTTDKQRPDALRFYERLGFIATHERMKLKL